MTRRDSLSRSPTHSAVPVVLLPWQQRSAAACAKNMGQNLFFFFFSPLFGKDTVRAYRRADPSTLNEYDTCQFIHLPIRMFAHPSLCVFVCVCVCVFVCVCHILDEAIYPFVCLCVYFDVMHSPYSGGSHLIMQLHLCRKGNAIRGDARQAKCFDRNHWRLKVAAAVPQIRLSY